VKVIFIEDVPNVARAGQTRVVADGYARNYLLPRKMAVLANSQAAAAVESHLKKIARQRAIEEAEMAELAKAINGTEITLTAKVGEKERLYGSVTTASIAEELSKTIGREVDKRKVDLAEPIRQVGVYDVTIRFTHDIMADISVTVMSDEPGAIRPEKTEKKSEEAEEKAEKAEKKAKKKAKPAKKDKEEKPEKAEKAEKPPKEKKVKSEKSEAVQETGETEEAEKVAKKAKKTKVKAEKKEGTEEGEEAVKSEEEAKES
jgi:large subunit ribosomal protein L9